MGILTDIYNTVARFFRAQDEQAGEDASKSVAQNRLKLVLMQDRTNLTPKVLEQMRGEMIELLSKYLDNKSIISPRICSRTLGVRFVLSCINTSFSRLVATDFEGSSPTCPSCGRKNLATVL